MYRELLARHSEVFRDTFLLPQSETTAAETYEGCPIVRMAEDGAEEWERVLGILHDAKGSQQYVIISEPSVEHTTDYVALHPLVVSIAIPRDFPSILWQLHCA